MSKSKFNTNSISDMLLNEESQEATKNNFKIVHIDIDEIQPNERNKNISMPGIEDLADNIGIVGLEQNLVVAPKKDGKYALLTGHRRLAALQLLVNDRGRDDLRLVPCVIYDPNKFQYTLSDESREALIWVSSNVMTRKPTTQDLFQFTKTLNEVYDELRKKNPKAILGTKKEFIAKELSISESQVQILNSINSHLCSSALEAFLSGELNLVVARDLAKLSDRDQKEFLQEFDDYSKISGLDIQRFKENIKAAKKAAKPEIDSYQVKDFSNIADTVSGLMLLYSEKTLTGRKAEKAYKLTEDIKKKLDDLQSLIALSN